MIFFYGLLIGVGLMGVFALITLAMKFWVVVSDGAAWGFFGLVGTIIVALSGVAQVVVLVLS